MVKDKIKDKIIVALDFSSLEKVKPMVKDLLPYVGCFKIGLQLITAIGAPKAINSILELGGKVFFDGKFYDIKNTVGEASLAVSSLGVSIFNIHASCGIEAMAAAVENKGNAKVLAVTVLTSLEENNAFLVFGAPTKAKVIQFARDAKLAGVDGIICSPQELEILSKQKELSSLLKVTPGVRPSWAAANDQKRIMTPGEAILAGATAIVIGRSITKPPKEVKSSIDAAILIHDEINKALGGK